MNPAISVLKGSDAVLLADAVSERITTLVGDRDRTDVLDQFTGDDYAVADAVLAANAVSMFGDRVIVIRNAARFSADELAPLIAYAADPAPTSKMLVVWEKAVAAGSSSKALPKKLADSVKASGGSVVDTDVGANSKVRQHWLDEQLANSPVLLVPAAKQFIARQLGEDLSRVVGLLRTLEGAFPPGTKLTPDDIEPFLGGAGGVPPWDLTDAIDRGDMATAVTNLRRMLAGGDRHPLQVMVTLTSHVQRMLRLDGSGVRDERAAAELLGMKGSTFPAKKALAQAQRMGSERIARAVQLLAVADADLRGRTAIPGDAVLEVLVARLARLNGQRR